MLRKPQPPADLHETSVLAARHADVGIVREAGRRRRLRRTAFVLGPMAVWMWMRIIGGNPVHPGFPVLPGGIKDFLPAFSLIILLGVSILVPILGAGKSPHVLFRPSELDVSLDDVKGSPVVVDEVVRSLNLFLAHKTFRETMGGTPRRAILFEGPPGTGKTFVAKAMAAEAGVPFLFVSSSAFQSMYYGQTNRKLRSYFKALRKHARQEGGAIGFIEEIDAIGAARSGMGSSGMKEGVAGVVNELLIQLQSFDSPTGSQRVKGWFVDAVNRFLPATLQLRKPKAVPANILVVGATNRADDLDPALLRPGRFDRTIAFDLPSRGGRREIIDHYLAKKAHAPELDAEDKRDALAASTYGYSPVMLEHLLDEALVWAIRRGADALSWEDVQRAKLTEEIGLAQPVEYAAAERVRIATHESGHATVAHLVGAGRRLDVLSIIKRKDALGLLAHSETEERFTRTQSELEAIIRIALGGMAAERLFLGEHSTGVSGDLAAATNAAAMMVGALGMAGSLVSMEAASMGTPANLVAKVLADEDGRAKVEALLEAARLEVELLMNEHRHVVEGLRDALLERDELIGAEITDVIAAADASVIDVRHVVSHP